MALAGVAVHLWLRRGSYRRPEEDGPLPRHLWVAPAVPLVGAVVVHRFAERFPEHWLVVALPWLVLVVAGSALAAIDADVHRLPNAITLPLVPVQLVLVAAASLAIDDGDALRRALMAAALVGGGFVVVAFVLFGSSIGMGDAKLMVSLALVLGWFGWTSVLSGIYLGFLLGGVAAVGLMLLRRAGRTTHLAFGPYLVAGALVAGLLA